MCLMETWIDANRAYTNEGMQGVRNLTKLIQDLDHSYRDTFGGPLISFLADNPGAIQAVMEWVDGQLLRNKEWQENLKASINADECKY